MCDFQVQHNPDWAKGLPLEVLANLAGGRDDLKAMRGLNKTWQQGFEGSVTALRVGPSGPFLPDTFPHRFPDLTSLCLGESLMAEVDLAQLAGLKNLRILNLGGESASWAAGAEGEQLSLRLNGSGLQHLNGLQLENLVLSHCQKLLDEVCPTEA